jgi:uncharacterized protein
MVNLDAVAARSRGSTDNCWSLTTGEAGATSQAVGLAEAVGLPHQHKTISLRAPWRWLPGHRCPLAMHGLAADGDPLAPPWPRLLITCGRRTTAVSMAIRRLSGGRTYTVHVQDPQCPPDRFDLVVPPRHDGLSGANVIPTRGALHRITERAISAAAAAQAQRFSALPRPLVAVLIGGSTRHYRLTPGHCRALATALLELAARRGVGLAVSVSRRTGAENTALLEAALTGSGHFFWGGRHTRGDNPYLALLGLADHLLVTGDSASMVSEAASTGKPVHVIAGGDYGRRLNAFHAALRAEGVTRAFTGELDGWEYAPVNDTPVIAAHIRAALGLPPQASNG